MITRKQSLALGRSFTVQQSMIEDLAIAEGIVDHVITDPPYSKRTQDNIRAGKRTRDNISVSTALDFAPADNEKRQRWASWIATATRRWAVVFSDHEGSVEWGKALERAGLVYVRTAIWVRKGGAPQMTGDRPAQGHECIVLAHKGRGMRWNAHGKFGRYEANVLRDDSRVHDTQKPINGLMLDILRDFVDEGETIADPFAGAASTLVAARHRGAFAWGADSLQRWADYGTRRAQASTALGIDE